MPGMFWPFNRMTLDGEDVGSIVRWIGHDAAIFGGNSGGPLVNMQGRSSASTRSAWGSRARFRADLAQEVATRHHERRPGASKLDRPRRAAAVEVVDHPARRARRRHDRRIARCQSGIRVRGRPDEARRIVTSTSGSRKNPALQSGRDATCRWASRLPRRCLRGGGERTLTVVPEDARKRRGADPRAACARHHGVEPDRVVGQGAPARGSHGRARARRPSGRSRRRREAGARR